MTRQCGDCQLCCKLLPVRPLGKKGGERCRYQRFGKGCTVYNKPAMPIDCKLWNCRWLVNDDAAELSRPDRSHYVIDIIPDHITFQNTETGAMRHIEVVQIWIDPKHPQAHRDPALRRWMIRRAEEGKAALIRFNERDALTIFPPPFDKDGQWHEIMGNPTEGEHTLADTVRALGGELKMVTTP